MPPLLVGVKTGTVALDSSMAISQKNLSEEPAIPLLGINPKDAQSYHKDMCSTMFIASLFVIARAWKQPKLSSAKEWIKKIWYICTMEYYTAEKNNGILKFAGKWMDL